MPTSVQILGLFGATAGVLAAIGAARRATRRRGHTTKRGGRNT